jgi:hypothetical protein
MVECILAAYNLLHPSFIIQTSNLSFQVIIFGPSSLNSPDIKSLVKGGHLDLSLPERLLRVFDLSI